MTHGRFVAFSSDATTLVTGDGNGFQDVFVHDTWTGVTERVSVTSDGHEANAPSFGQPRPAIGGDGRLVVFASGASNLSPGACTIRATHRTEHACVLPSGAPVICQSPSLSSDARWLAFADSQGSSTKIVVCATCAPATPWASGTAMVPSTECQRSLPRVQCLVWRTLHRRSRPGR